MKVVITTTRERIPDAPPVEGAQKEQVQIHDVYDVNDTIVTEEYWVVEVEDIYKFATTLGIAIIVFPTMAGETYPTIEIYNDYRE